MRPERQRRPLGRRRRARLGCLLVGVALLAACDDGEVERRAAPRVKIGFDLEILDENGLLGEGDGKHALSYELCLPAEEQAVAQVRALDPTAEVQVSSPGRIGCDESEVLVIGHTNQPGFRSVLLELAARDDVARIEQAFFE